MIAWPRKPSCDPSQAFGCAGMPRPNGRVVAPRLYAVRIDDKATAGWHLHNSGTYCWKRLIITADDFGASVPINEAVEKGHRGGVLSAASLMVGAPAMADAGGAGAPSAFARRGLHLTLVDGNPVLAPRQIPSLLEP